jgi:autotransporter passenger strand-loop-strand repeat protein
VQDSAGTVDGASVDGQLELFIGGVASGAAVSSGGTLDVEVSGIATGTLVSSGGLLVVHSGGIASGGTIYASGEATVSAGGQANGLTISSGGTIEVLSSGSATGIVVFSSGSLEVRSGGAASATVISNGGSAEVLSGGSTIGTVLSSGGKLQVDANGIASGTQILTGGTETLLGVDNNASVGGTLIVSSGGVATSETILSGGVLDVFGGANINNLALSAGATVIIDSGYFDSGVTVQSGITVDVASSGFVRNTTLLSGAKLVVLSGGTADPTVISSGASETVSSGGLDDIAQIRGGIQYVFGSATGATIYAGSQVVESGGVASFTTISGGSMVLVASGSAISAQVLAGGQLLDSGGNVATATVLGSLTAVSGGHVSGAIVSSGGELNVSAGGVAVRGIVSGGGAATVGAGGQAISTIIQSFATLNVLSGGTVSGTNIVQSGTEYLSGSDTSALVAGNLVVYAGGVANGAEIQSGGALRDSGVVDGATVFNGGGLTVVSGGPISGSVVFGAAEVSSGGQATGTVVSAGGTLTVDAGGSVSGTQIAFDGQENLFGSDTSATVSGTMTLFSGAVASGTDVEAGGILFVSNGTVDNATVIGTVSAFSGGFVSGGVVSGSVDIGAGASASSLQIDGMLTVESGGAISSVVVSSDGNLDVASGAQASGTQIQVGGFETLEGSDTNDFISGNLIVSSGGTLTSATIGTSGLLDLAQGGVISGGITFSGTSAGLAIEDVSTMSLGNIISGLAPGDFFFLGIAYDSSMSAGIVSGSQNLLEVTSGGLAVYDLQLDPNQDFTGDTFSVTPVFSGMAAQVTENPCYCAGTLIATDRGDVPVEKLAIGDHVLTLSGEPRPIKWIGRRSYRRPFIADNVMPIRINAGALRENVPLRDLYVSPEHALYIDAVLVPSQHLVNGVSIERCTQVESVDYFHIELASHDVIFAEGTPAETFVDCDSRLMFHNAAEFAALYPGDTSPGWAFCAPRVEQGPTIERIRRAISARAGLPHGDDATLCGPLDGYLDDVSHTLINGWAFDPSLPNTPIWLEVLVNDGVIGRVLADRYRADVAQAGNGDGRHGFALWLQHGLSPLERHVIRVCRVDDGCELLGSPRVLEPQELACSTRAADLLPVLRNATQRAPDDTALDALSAMFRRGLAWVEEARAERAARPDTHQASLLARAHAQPQKRRALIIDDRMPDPTRDAGSNAVLGHMRALGELGYAVEFVAARERDGRVADHVLSGGFDNVRWHTTSESVEDVLSRNADGYELVYLHRLSNAVAYAGLVRQWCPHAHLVYSVADLHHVRMARQAQVQALPQLMARAQSVKQAELLAMRLVDAVITHSTAEAAYLSALAPGARVHVVPWPIAVTPPGISFGKRSGLAFIGSVAHEPNPDAVLWLIEEIMPRVWQRNRSITCQIVGQDWSDFLTGKFDRRIRFVGRVPDLAAVLDQVRLTVAPLRFGAGLKGKVLDSLAAGVPCAMSAIAAEGIPIGPGLNALVGRNAAELAELICRLHGSKPFNAAMSTAGRTVITAGFNMAREKSALAAALQRSNAVRTPDHPARSATA